jgi:hypothetical protein
MKNKDVQVGGDHYLRYKIQPAEFLHANNVPFIEGCIIEYLLRFRDKNGKQDLLKAKHFIDLLMELEYGAETEESNTADKGTGSST